MKPIRKWWQRRRLRARLDEVRTQWQLLSAERTHTLEMLNEACQELIRYRSYLQVHSAQVSPTRDKVNSLSIQLNLIGLQIDLYQRTETQLLAELASL